MAFINEYISKEDIEKYDIFGIRNKFLTGSYQITKEREKHFNLTWVIDRERVGFVMQEELLTKIQILDKVQAKKYGI